MEYIVIEKHETEFSSPLLVKRNEKVIVKGESEHWQGWIYCIKQDGSNEGYVPKQIIEYTDNYGIITEDYSAKELNVREGDILEGIKELNGWMWLRNETTNEIGWVPMEKLKKLKLNKNRLNKNLKPM
jgi:hypothetical protein